MSFTITCDKCGNKMTVKDKGNYHSGKIDFYPEENRDYDYLIVSRTLSMFCNAEGCNNEVEFNC